MLRNYANFLGSRISVGDIPGRPEDSGLDIAIYQHERNNVIDDVYTANMNYEEVEIVSEPNNNGEVYALNTFIIWPNESDFKDTLRFNTFQIKLTN